MTHKNNAFTLVELLVVISIIALLAALLMPAIQAAREAARRAQCMSNQRQVAFALQNHDNNHKAFPALRAALRANDLSGEYYHAWNDKGGPFWEWFGSGGVAGNSANGCPLFPTATWVAFILPFMEQNTAWKQLYDGTITDRTVYELVLPVMRCRSSGNSSNDNRINYVVNAGPTNYIGVSWGDWDAPSGTGSNAMGHGSEASIDTSLPRRRANRFTLFFDNLVTEGLWADSPTGTPYQRCTTRVSVEDVTRMDGTSMTILLSENEDAGHWIWYLDDITVPQAVWRTPGALSDFPNFFPPINLSSSNLLIYRLENVEFFVAFNYPRATYEEDFFQETGGIPRYTPPVIGGRVKEWPAPMFINEGRNLSFLYSEPYRKSRPSSGHPGGVVAAFCDNSVRFLSEDMDKTTFVYLCQPGSNVIINPKDLDW